jgi:hypothetical protein
MDHTDQASRSPIYIYPLLKFSKLREIPSAIEVAAARTQLKLAEEELRRLDPDLVLILANRAHKPYQPVSFGRFSHQKAADRVGQRNYLALCPAGFTPPFEASTTHSSSPNHTNLFFVEEHCVWDARFMEGAHKH